MTPVPGHLLATPLPFSALSTASEVLVGLDLSGRTMLVTGCNSGIGFETMRGLAAHGAHILGLARSEKAARDACARIVGSATPVACDLSNLASVRVAIQAIQDLGCQVDVIIANAGIVGTKKPQVKYGVEMQFLVNYLSHFCLINELLNLVPDRTGRIVVVSSDASIKQAPKQGILFDNLDGRHFYKPFSFYGQSKLAGALFASELSRRLQARGISVNSVHPGAIGGTGFSRNFGFPLNIVMAIASRFMKTIPQGAATQVLLATSPLVAGITGRYWADCQVARGSKFLDDAGMARKLWEVSEEILAEQRDDDRR